MLKVTSTLLLACLCALSLGCGRSTATKTTAHDEEAIAKCLPEGITLDRPLERVGGRPASKLTVRDKLKELGAYGKGGTLYDASGKEIRFFIRHRAGTYRLGEREKEWERQRQEEGRLRERYRVVVLQQLDE